MGELTTLPHGADYVATWVAVVFPASRSPSLSAAIEIARGAAQFSAIGTGRGMLYVAGFEPHREQAARAVALLQLVGEWKGVQVWAGGRQRGVWPARGVLECFITTETCTDWRAHCIVTVDVAQYPPGGGALISLLTGAAPPPPPPPKDMRVFPCQRARQGFRFDHMHPSSYADQAQAAAVAMGCDWCPRFDASNTGRASSG